MNLNYTLFKRKNSKIWYFYYYKDGFRYSKSTGKTRKYKAEEYCENFLDEPEKKEIYLKDYAKDFFVWGKCIWIRAQHDWDRYFSESTAKWRRAHYENYLLPKFGKRYLRTITKKEVRDWLITLELTNQTKNHILFTFRIILREAEEEELIEYNPLEKLKAFGTKSKVIRDIFTVDDLALLFPADMTQLLDVWRNSKYASLYLVLATTGLRSGEARALQWKHILDNRWLLIEQAAKHNGTVAETKTRNERLVFLPEKTRDTLNQWKGETLFQEPEDYIFFGADRNRPINVTTVSKLLPKAMKKVGIDTENRNLVVHSFRHTFNTMMRKILPEDTLRQFTGHKSQSMTELYDHPTLEDKLSKLQSSAPLIEQAWKS